jgi:alpha-tubulin suppressor-like RCC1 family protein
MHGFRRFAAIALVALIAACRDNVGPGAAVPDLIGYWDWTALATFPGSGITCNDTGSFVFARQGATYAGIAQSVSVCRQSGGSYAYSVTDSLLNVRVSGSALTFDETRYLGTDACADTASTVPGSPDQLIGTMTCPFEQATWHAVRGTPIASISVSPSTVLTVVAGRPSLATVLRTAGGSRAFGRAVSWSTDNPSVASVDTAGNVTATAAGAAHVTATAAGLSGSASITVLAPTAMGAVGAGDARTCALGADGYAYCWGVDPVVRSGALPLPIPSDVRFTSLATGYRFSCALTGAGAAYCWGANESGQLGNASNADAPAPVAVAGGLVFASLAAGGHHACGLTTAGAAWCWGRDSSGQHGDGSTVTSAVPVPVTGARTFVALSAGANHTCAIAAGAGTLYCWGDNSLGQLGDSTITPRAFPVPVAGSVVRVSAGYFHTCAIKVGGAAWCWGAGGSGQLGTGTTTDQRAPAAVAGSHTFASISAGLIHTCAVDAGGAAWCWGVNAWGQLGVPGPFNMTPITSPVAVSGAFAFSSISAGLYTYSDESINAGTAAHTCGVTVGDLTYCWGVNNVGQVGTGQIAFTPVTTPAKVADQP